MLRIKLLTVVGEYDSMLDAMEAYRALVEIVDPDFRSLVRVERLEAGEWVRFDVETFLDGMAQLLGVK